MRGFGCRITPAGRRTYYVKYRTLTGTQRRMKLGDDGILSLRQARDQAKVLAAIRRGEAPAQARQVGRTAPTVAELGKRCKNQRDPITRPELAREILKVALYVLYQTLTMRALAQVGKIQDSGVVPGNTSASARTHRHVCVGEGEAE